MKKVFYSLAVILATCLMVAMVSSCNKEGKEWGDLSALKGTTWKKDDAPRMEITFPNQDNPIGKSGSTKLESTAPFKVDAIKGKKITITQDDKSITFTATFSGDKLTISEWSLSTNASWHNGVYTKQN
ncbi:MAG: hypothetical protein LBP96_01255 [Bacteroidales bacterium]|jgi:hypothetical protein|nr:hypothetical protein [Bacteroidales bacterium]